MTLTKCERCPLYGRVQVGHDGNVDSPIAFVGQSPGSVEVQTLLPFQGPAGKRFNHILDEVPLAREDIYVTNLVKCFLGQGESVTEKMALSCWPLLSSELEGRQVIVLLGKPAAKYTRELYRGSAILFEMMHPAAALRKALWEVKLQQQTKELRKVLMDAGLLEQCQGESPNR